MERSDKRHKSGEIPVWFFGFNLLNLQVYNLPPLIHMAQNQKISAELSAEAKQEIIKKIEEISNYLPFLVGIDSNERMSMRKMGQKSLSYVLDCERSARMFPDAMPPTIDVEEMRKDISLHQDLAEIKVYLSTLMAGIDSSMMAAGSDVMITADSIYDYFKIASLQSGNYKSVVDEISQRFKR